MRSLRYFTPIMLTGVLGLSLTSCGSSTSKTRNVESDTTACISQSDSSLTRDGQLELHFCPGVTYWESQESDDSAPGKKKIPVNGVSEVSFMGFRSMTIRSFDAQGKVLGIDKISLNGSHGGFAYSADTTGSSPIFYEAAPANWSGEASDPNVEHTSALELVQQFNNASAPVGDWFMPNRSELTPLMEDATLAKIVGLNLSGRSSAYWISDKIDGARFGVNGPVNGVIRSAAAPGGFSYWQNQPAKGVVAYVRPVRSFTPNGGPTILVSAQLSAAVSDSTSTSSLPESTTSSITAAETTQPVNTVETNTEPEQITQIHLIRLSKPIVNLGTDATSIQITPQDVKENIVDMAPMAIASIVISFDGGEKFDISLTGSTEIHIPASAKNAVIQLTSATGETIQIPKTIVRSSEEATTTTQAPSHQPASAPAMNEKSGSSGGVSLMMMVGIAILLLIAAGTVQRRRSLNK